MSVDTSIDDTGKLRGIETKIEKARRLLAEDRVAELDDGTFRVLGDTTIHALSIGKSDVHCSCKGSSFNGRCSHKLSVEILLSWKRRVA